MITRLAQFAFWAAVALALFFAVKPVPAMPLEPSDKTLHMLAFFTLAVLGSFAYPRLSPLTLAAWLIAFGGLIELMQMIPALNRDADMVDWGADAIAAFAGLALVQICRRIARPAS